MKKDKKEKSKSYWKEIEGFLWKATIDSILKNNSIHGPSLIFGADNIFLAILYILLTLLFLAYCTYQIVNTILTYLSYEIVTTTEVRTEAPAQFPVVTFCNIDPFDQNFAGYEIYDIMSSMTSIEPSLFNTTFEYEMELEDYYKFNLLSRYLDRTYYLGLGLSWQINQMLVSCRFQGKMCDQEDFIFVYDFYYSSCFRFNQGKMKNGSDEAIKYIGKPGWRNGLQLELYAGLVEQQEQFVASRGFRITVFNQSNPYQILDETGINVAPGMQTNVAIKRVFINHLKTPYGNCLDNDITKINWNQTDALKFMYSNFIQGNEVYDTGYFYWNWTLTYSQSLCVKLCYQKYLWESCSCYDVTLPKSIAVVQVYALNACVNRTQLYCMKNIQDKFYSNKTLFEPCYVQCPIECNEVKYEYKTSMASYPTSYYADLLTNNNAFNDVINAWFAFGGYSLINYTNEYTALSRAISKINIFYEDMLYTVIEESPAMELEIFICYLGGLFGMFMGGSFLSLAIVLEMIYYFSLYAFRIYHGRHNMSHTKKLLRTTIAMEKFNKAINDQELKSDEQDVRVLGPSISPPVSASNDSRSSIQQVENRIHTGRVRSAASSTLHLHDTLTIESEDMSGSTSSQIIEERIASTAKSATDDSKLKEEAKRKIDDLTSFAVFEKRASHPKSKHRLTSLDRKKSNHIVPLSTLN